MTWSFSYSSRSATTLCSLKMQSCSSRRPITCCQVASWPNLEPQRDEHAWTMEQPFRLWRKAKEFLERSGGRKGTGRKSCRETGSCEPKAILKARLPA